MGETKHTPTPWRVEYKPAGTCIFSNEPNFLLLSMSYTQTDKTTVANASRIVKCVNAMEGIEEPAEFMDIVKTIITAIQEGTELKPDSLVVQAVAAAIK